MKMYRVQETLPIRVITRYEINLDNSFFSKSFGNLIYRRTYFSMNKPTTWCKSGQVSLVSSSCLYKTQSERALAQIYHIWIGALSPDEYQFHLLLHRNSHNSQATYPKRLNHWRTQKAMGRCSCRRTNGRTDVSLNPVYPNSTFGGARVW